VIYKVQCPFGMMDRTITIDKVATQSQDTAVGEGGDEHEDRRPNGEFEFVVYQIEPTRGHDSRTNKLGRTQPRRLQPSCSNRVYHALTNEFQVLHGGGTGKGRRIVQKGQALGRVVVWIGSDIHRARWERVRLGPWVD
jgi:hypothetical protein